jgi:hypothetical protein
MTPTQIETKARRLYNAVGDTNWSSTEIVDIIHLGSLEITRDCDLVIEKKFSLTTTIAVGEYAFPTNATAIKRLTYNGKKLKEISMREDDSLTLENQLATDQGDTEYYYVWNRTINLRPLPASAVALDVFAICNEDELTSSSTIDIPIAYHGSLVVYVAMQMAAKDLNWAMYDRLDAKWKDEKLAIRSHIKRSKRADGFAVVKVEELLPYTTLGLK